MTQRTRPRDARSVSLQRHRVAIATAGLAAALVTVPFVDRALAEPSMDRGGAAVARGAPRTVAGSATRTVAAPVPVVVGQEAVVEIPSLDISLPVVPGGQPVIDEGVAAHYSTTRGPVVDAGQPGTYWLAAHSTTHGAPFGRLPAIANGAEVRVKTLSGVTFTYTVTSRDLVGTVAAFTTVFGSDTTTARILLQTCEGSQRLLVHGVLASEGFAHAD